MSESVRSRFRQDPPPPLRPFVVEYWGLVRDLAAAGGFTITPDCFGEIICCVGDLYAVGEDGAEKLPTCFFVGLLAGPLRVEAAGVVRCMAARLSAWSVGQFLARHPAARPGGWSDASAFFGSRLDRVTDLVRQCDWTSGAQEFDALLAAEIRFWSVGAAARDVVRAFLGTDRRPTAAVADERGTSNRQVERRVRALTGTSPKQLASLARFQQVRDAIWADPAVDLVGLALAAGYADQPHMTREFRRYAGLTPARFARSSAAQRQSLATEPVAFVQDPGAGQK